MSKMNSFILWSVMNVLLIINTVVSVADAQSDEDYDAYYYETDECRLLLRCWNDQVDNFVGDRYYLRNTTVFHFCEILDEFKLCVDIHQANCSDSDSDSEHHLRADKVKAMGNIVCNAAGRSAVEEFETLQCTIDEEKKERLQDALDMCFYTNSIICSQGPTEARLCVKEAIQSDCGENGARVFASIAWEKHKSVLYAQLCNQ
ncbi:uncharacterized protein LOC131953795 [Physella acuta]|uniref:uncharacterized protein LOC131953795 n=1 Tax=Physella acuta TaxID=109671 RepID=UPI0027DAF358|nr:uncharacterized protein LOC131953795 [Physella acuta]